MSSKGGADLVAVGYIVGAHGIRGEIKVDVLTYFPERFEAGGELLMVSPEERVEGVKILSSRAHLGRFLLTLEGIPDRTAAEGLRGNYLKIPPDKLTPLPPGRYYHFQLLELEVKTEEGEPLGRVEEVLPTGSNLVLVVREGTRELLLPLIDDVVRRVDLEAREVTVHLMEGLLPEDRSCG